MSEPPNINNKTSTLDRGVLTFPRLILLTSILIQVISCLFTDISADISETSNVRDPVSVLHHVFG